MFARQTAFVSPAVPHSVRARWLAEGGQLVSAAYARQVHRSILRESRLTCRVQGGAVDHFFGYDDEMEDPWSSRLLAIGIEVLAHHYIVDSLEKGAVVDPLSYRLKRSRSRFPLSQLQIVYHTDDSARSSLSTSILTHGLDNSHDQTQIACSMPCERAQTSLHSPAPSLDERFIGITEISTGPIEQPSSPSVKVEVSSIFLPETSPLEVGKTVDDTLYDVVIKKEEEDMIDSLSSFGDRAWSRSSVEMATQTTHSSVSSSPSIKLQQREELEIISHESPKHTPSHQSPSPVLNPARPPLISSISTFLNSLPTELIGTYSEPLQRSLALREDLRELRNGVDGFEARSMKKRKRGPA